MPIKISFEDIIQFIKEICDFKKIKFRRKSSTAKFDQNDLELLMLFIILFLPISLKKYGILQKYDLEMQNYLFDKFPSLIRWDDYESLKESKKESFFNIKARADNILQSLELECDEIQFNTKSDQHIEAFSVKNKKDIPKRNILLKFKQTQGSKIQVRIGIDLKDVNGTNASDKHIEIVDMFIKKDKK